MRRPLRRKTKVPRGQASRIAPQVAPTKGWVADENIVVTDPEAAYQLDNWFPETNSIKLRAGYELHNFIVGGPPINTIMVYEAGAALQIFAAAGSAIYDVTNTDSTVSPPAHNFEWRQPFGNRPVFIRLPTGQGPRIAAGGASLTIAGRWV